MTNLSTPLHEGMRCCPVCKHFSIFTERDLRDGFPDTGLCHWCRAPMSISGKVLELPNSGAGMTVEQIAEMFGVDISVLMGPSGG